MSWDEVAATQSGIITRAQLLAAGRTDSGVTRLLRSGAIRRLGEGVYRVRGAPLTYDAALWRAVLESGGALGFGTAAALWGCAVEPPDRIDIIVGRHDHPLPIRGVRFRRRDYPASLLTRRSGLPATTRVDSLLDLMGTMRLGKASQLADRAIQQRWLGPEDIARRLRNRPKQRGNGILQILATMSGDGAAAHSERVLHRVLRQGGITGWEANVAVFGGGRKIAEPDVLFRAAGLIVEVDGMAYHTDADRFQRDRSRQNDLVTAGWRVLRFTWHDLIDRPGYVLAQIRQQLLAAA